MYQNPIYGDMSDIRVNTLYEIAGEVYDTWTNRRLLPEGAGYRRTFYLEVDEDSVHEIVLDIDATKGEVHYDGTLIGIDGMEPEGCDLNFSLTNGDRFILTVIDWSV